MAIGQGKKFIDKPGLDHGAATAGLAAASLLTGAGATALVGRTFNLPGVERAGMKVLETTANGVNTTGKYIGKGAEKVFNAAVQHPFATLGVLAVAAGTGYYLYQNNDDSKGEAKPEAGAQTVSEAAKEAAKKE